jgi:hypothetical protein
MATTAMFERVLVKRDKAQEHLGGSANSVSTYRPLDPYL